MQCFAGALRALPSDLDVQGHEPAALSSLSDHELVRAVALAIGRPKVDRVSSFLLHAPLELLARAALLPLVEPGYRSATRMRIARIAALYAEGDELEPPATAFASIAAAWSALAAALREGDPDAADATITHLADRLPCDALCLGLTDPVAPCLGAAAHMPLLLAALADAQPRFAALAPMLRPAIRMLAAWPDQRLSWIDRPEEKGGPEDLWSALAAPPRVDLATDFIAPTMLAVEADGLAERLLARATRRPPEEVAHTVARIAAWSMIQDDPIHAPYGWTHCLTLPQGISALHRYSSRPDRLARIAATYVLGFRATLGSVRLDFAQTLPALPEIATLAGYAATHEDAHLAKYVVACLTAAEADPAARPLFTAAAHHLAAWWRSSP